MLQSFLAFLGGEPGEEKPMLLLLAKGFCMGVFLATYQIGSETLFLTTVGAEHLDNAFFVAGFLGIFSTYLYVQLQRKINFSSLVVSNAFITFLVLVGLVWVFLFSDLGAAEGEFQYLPFILFVLIGPISSVTLLGFWGVFGRVFNLKQSKRIIGGIDTGQLTATMVAFFSIPAMTELGLIDKTNDLLFISAGASFGILVFTVWIVKDFNVDSASKIRKTDKVKPVKFIDLFRNKYLRMLSLFLIFSMGSAVFANYVFLSATETMYPDEEELRNFLSFFGGTIMVVSFLIQSFINDIIIGRYGLKVSLMVMPFILAIFTLGAIGTGHAFGYEVKDEEGYYVFFFVFTALGRLFTASLKDALENPAFKLFFLPFDLKIRFDVQSKIEGVVNEVAVLVAGAMQIGLGLLHFFELIHYLYFVMALAFVIIYYAGKLFMEYKNALKSTLKDQKNSLKGEGTRNEHNTINVIKGELRKKSPERALNALKLMERMEPIMLDYSLLDFIRSSDKKLRLYAYKRLGQLRSFNTLDILEREVKKEKDADVKKVAAEAIAVLHEIDDFKLTETGIKKLVRSTDIKDRIYATKALVKLEEDKYVPFLAELMRDINPHVRRSAMISAGKLKRSEFWSILIENLHLPAYSNSADSALISSGESMFGTIDSAFYKTGQEYDAMFRIIQILGKVGGRPAIDLLWKKIDFPDKQIVSEILLSLSYVGFEAKEFQAARIKIAIEEDIGDIAWNIKALMEIPKDDFIDKMIRDAMIEENNKNFENVFMLLAMIYDAQSIRLVSDNIEVGTTDSVSFAIEMLDIFVDEDLKPKLFPVLDDIKEDEKLEKLNNFFPPEDFESYEDLLLQIINRDYNHINKWTKSLAMYKLTLMRGVGVKDDIIANLFNPDGYMLQTAAAVIYRLNKDEYHHHTRRLKSSTKKDLDKAIVPPVFKSDEEKWHQKLLFVERAILLKQLEIFESIPGVILVEVAKCLEEIKISKGTTIIDKGDNGNSPVYIVLTGRLKVHDGDKVIRVLKEREITGHKLIISTDVNPHSVTADADSVLLVLDKDQLYDKVSKHIEMVDGILSIVNEVAEKEEVESIF
ncbi:MAG: HEAT repeat domain-containing protein [Cyclobacteriaceae bacterium]